MLPSLWLTSLKRQLRTRFSRSSRARRNRNQRHQLPSARALISRNAAETLEDRTLLTAFTVVNTNDSGAGSLRDAIEQANANAGADTISFDAALAGQTIVLGDEILIHEDLSITGLGADQLTLDGNGDSRIFRIDDGVANTDITVEISGLTLANGSADHGGAIYSFYADLSIVNSKLTGNTAVGTAEEEGHGAGIYQSLGSLTVDTTEFSYNKAIGEGGQGGGIYLSQTSQATITNATFTSNSAFTGGAISRVSGSLTIEHSEFTENHSTSGFGGGALYLSGGSTQVIDSTFTENVAQTNGGAISLFTGELTVSASTFTENRSSGIGGGVYIGSTDVIIQESTFTSNQSGSGGGIGMLGRGTLKLVSSTLHQNVATSNGGALFDNGPLSISIINSTLSENVAAHKGGGLYTFAYTDVSVINSTIVKNEATHFSGGGIKREFTSGSFQLSNSIVAGNTSNQISGSYTGSSNIIRSSIDGLIDPILRDNGGPTKTHALSIGSAAIDAGNNFSAQTAGLSIDQRGGLHHRIFNGIVDIGAYEYYSGVLRVDSLSDLDDGNYTSGHLTLREAIKLANETPEADQIIFSSSLTNKTIVLNTEILISSSMTITGLGAEQLSISGDYNSRIFTIDDSNIETEIVVQLSGLSLINGFSENGGAILNYENLTVSESLFSGNDVRAVQYGDEALNNGGGIHNDHGTLTIISTTFTNNYAFEGGGIYNNNGFLTVTDSEFRENITTRKWGGGGGISHVDGSLTVRRSTFAENSASFGAGIYFNVNSVQNGPQPELTMDVSDSVFSKNTADDGGGIYFDAPYQNDSQVAFVTNSTFTENVTSGDGAGIFFDFGQAFVNNSIFRGNVSDRTGGGIGSSWTTLTVQNSTFSQNSARLYGGGIANGGFFAEEGGGDVSIINSTLSENHSSNNGGGFFSLSGFVNIVNSTISGNSAKNGGAIYTRPEGPGSIMISNSTITGNTADYAGGILSNWVSVAFTNSILAGNSTSDSKPQNAGIIVHTNSIIQDSAEGLLDPVLRDNGGPTKTHALLLGSAAIDAGDNTAVIDAEIDFDQRGTGFDRVVGGAVDLGAYEVQVFSTQIDLRIVDSKTSTSENGETNLLPKNLDWIDEWSGYWLEIWISTPTITDLGILSTTLELTYNTAITTATSIEYGAAFTVNQTGTINNQTGTIENLSAETSLTDVGDDQRVLFARIRFESTTEDGVDLDLAGRSLNPQSPAFVIHHPEILFIDDVASEEVHGPAPTTQIWANPFDLNDDDAINFRDLVLLINSYSTIPSESNSDYSWFADLNQNNRVDFGDLVSFINNYGKSKANQSPVDYPQNYPDAWNQLLTVNSLSEPQANANPVTQAAAETVLESVVEQVSRDLTPTQNETLDQVHIEVVDLAGDTLGRAVPGTIYIDVNAAGRGWFVDASPADHSEFAYDSELTLIALPDSEAADGIDLWSVILHELGHLLGHEHETEGVMQETLAPGVRNLPGWEEASDQFFAELTEDTNLIAF
ncbi:choice-of-anchor Q domain-containing protein [uncultured Gimesia sp.]|uniref:choice-of-anchor Q domain-containing protein n=1 Tax=uncultured Gimesia sp. TaxID=1678688 RepID=UPI0030D91533